MPLARGRQVFTTAHAGQRAISLLLYQGNDGLASRNKLLGQFHLDGLPRAPAGAPQVEVGARAPGTAPHLWGMQARSSCRA